MKYTVTFEHQIGDQVKIKAIDCKAYVEAMMVAIHGPEYRIGYWFEGKRFSEWVREHEITSA